MWVRAMKVYDEVAKVVEPKKQKLAEAMAELNEEQAKLAGEAGELAEVIAKVDELQASATRRSPRRTGCVAEPTETVVAARARRQAHGRARRRGGALEGDGRTSWERRINLVGDIFISAAFIAYNGPFTAQLPQGHHRRSGSTVQEKAIPARRRLLARQA